MSPHLQTCRSRFLLCGQRSTGSTQCNKQDLFSPGWLLKKAAFPTLQAGWHLAPGQMALSLFSLQYALFASTQLYQKALLLLSNLLL